MSAALRENRSAAFAGGATEAAGKTAGGELVWSPAGSKVAGRAA
jgi:hypothetical protein